MNAARLFVSILRQQHEGVKGEQARLVKRVDRSLTAAEELLSALLDISKLDSGMIPTGFVQDSSRIRIRVRESSRMQAGFNQDSRRTLAGFREDSDKIQPGCRQASGKIQAGFMQDSCRIQVGFKQDAVKVQTGFTEDSG